ncbi:PREDICTED: uncharacterized protein LOC105363692 [Ceratosolen solmsi marchali]|uniref:Uncharacterized protein LOC105363692 n=1 Tax=Ceratosolen solmsi marchali TaxID=326594 RepID=A0AAJ6YKH7_9HYME|nr:PREDICTED: uncharacterized protein LOC105363692 [Ceratosolen solmsi marchali]
MVFYCVVPGCKTNRKGYLKLSLFSIPKDDERKKKWENAIGISNLQRSKHRVCEKHFLPQNIIRSTEHRDSDGNVIAILPLQCYKLTEDAVPSLEHGNNCEKVNDAKKCESPSLQSTFENVFNDITNQISSTDIINIEDLPVTIAEDVDSRNSKIIEIHNIDDTCFIKKSINSDSLELSSNFFILKKCNSNKKSADDASSKTENNQDICERQTIFSLLCENINLINLSYDWIVHVPSNKASIVFAEISVDTYDNESYNSNCTIKRSLIIKNTMNFSFNALGKNLDSEQLDLSNVFHNFEELQITLNKFSSMIFCSGIADINGVDLVKDNIAYTDCFNKLRHNNCYILSSRRKCKICENVRKTVSQKKRRMSRRSPDKERPNYSKLANKNVLHSWKKRIQAQRGVIKRAKNKIECLRKQVNEMKAGLSKIDLQSVLQKCSEYKISDIQRTLIEQIVSSAKVKSEKGRRYNEDWTMLCILMHTRSPKEYKHLQSLGILPLPCVRTVRRYLSLINQFNSNEISQREEESSNEDNDQSNKTIIDTPNIEDNSL